jgi:repressor LexA
MHGTSPKQREILDFLREEALAGRPSPTHREIAMRFGFKSHRAAACHLEALRKKGLIGHQNGKPRSTTLFLPSIPVNGFAIPLFGSIPAGFGDERQSEHTERVTVDFSMLGFKPTRNTFALRVTGDSMIGRHICNGDIVILEHELEPRHGQIVAALIDGKSTLKTFIIKGTKSFLRAENPKYHDLLPSEELMIQGVFKGLIRRSRE